MRRAKVLRKKEKTYLAPLDPSTQGLPEKEKHVQFAGVLHPAAQARPAARVVPETGGKRIKDLGALERLGGKGGTY